jgi:EmrB/QacA subfamily drug resistance transporter
MTAASSNDTQPRRWWSALAILVGTWSGTSLNSMIPVSLPDMLDTFGLGIDLGVWIISVFVLFSAVFMPISGWLGDRYGYRRVYLVGFSGVVASAWVAALAPGFGWLIGARTLQGIFNSVGLPSTMGIISSTFSSRERGLAMGVWAAVNGASHGLGPAISGFLVERYGWPATFWLNGSTALLAVLLILILVPSDRRRDSRPFDLLGAGALTLAMLTLMFTLRQSNDLGWATTASIGLWTIFGGLLLAFVVIERRVTQPFVKLELFAKRQYSVITAVSCAQFMVLIGLQLLLSLYLIQLRGLAEGLAGRLILPLASTLALFSPVAGRVADRLGFRRSMMIGLAIVTITVGSMGFWNTSTPAWLVVATLIPAGLGMGFAHSQGATGVSLAVGKDELGVALGIYNMLRFIAGTIGVNVLGIVVEGGRTGGALPLQPFQVSFYLLTAVAAAGLLLTVALPRTSITVEVAPGSSEESYQ